MSYEEQTSQSTLDKIDDGALISLLAKQNLAHEVKLRIAKYYKSSRLSNDDIFDDDYFITKEQFMQMDKSERESSGCLSMMAAADLIDILTIESLPRDTIRFIRDELLNRFSESDYDEECDQSEITRRLAEIMQALKETASVLKVTPVVTTTYPLVKPIKATCPNCEKQDVLVCQSCGYCAKCHDHRNCTPPPDNSNQNNLMNQIFQQALIKRFF